MDPHQQQLLTELRGLRQEVREMHSKVTKLWGLIWFISLAGVCTLIQSVAPMILLGAIYCFDRFVLKKPKLEI
jgi:hypothetical protein